MLTGQSKVEGGKLYKTEGSADVLARFEFDVVATKNQDIVLEFQYSGTDETLQSVIIDGVTSTNILATKPASAVFSLDINEKIPKTGISMNTLGIILLKKLSKKKWLTFFGMYRIVLGISIIFLEIL